MASASGSVPATTDTLIAIKVAIDGSNRKFKLPLKDLSPTVLPAKLRSILQVPADKNLTLERFSDSAAAFLALEEDNAAAYKQLFRAAKAKLKLRLRATITSELLPSDSNKSEETLVPKLQTLSHDAPPNLPLPPPQTSVTDLLRLKVATSHMHLEKAEDMFCDRNMALRMKTEVFPQAQKCTWQVYCNNCDRVMKDVHFHCGICDNGDYDLCEVCMKAGRVCPGKDHWLVKRTIQNGIVVASTTEKIMPKPKSTSPETEMPGAFAKSLIDTSVPTEAQRTCNVCVRVLPERAMITCSHCDDFDLCVPCLVECKHGHHPGHVFEAISTDSPLPQNAIDLCAAGRNIRHHAICDGCEKTIYGVRHKCLNCPDWDYCGDCVKNAFTSHSGHRFVKIYEALDSSLGDQIVHHGITCDGPLCAAKLKPTVLTGIRYKCAICDDTDFCAACEAHPSNKHNKTHPLIKFKTQVNQVTVTTHGEDAEGQPLAPMGDVRAAPVATASKQTNTEPLIEMKGSIAPLPLRKSPASIANNKLEAHFSRSLIADGHVLQANRDFMQVWTMKNPGPNSWPKDCSVRFISGDFILRLDHSRPASESDLALAQRSNTNSVTVAPGSTYQFCVLMRSPRKTGKYVSYWRLQDPEGNLFGHKLWCEIEVKEAPAIPHLPMNLTKDAPPLYVSRPDTGIMNRQEMIQQARKKSQERIYDAPPRYWHRASDNSPELLQNGETKPLSNTQAQNDTVARNKPRHHCRQYPQTSGTTPRTCGYAPNMGKQIGPSEPQGSDQRSLSDYSMQLMLLEQQNKRRLLLAKQEQDNGVAKVNGPKSIPVTDGKEPVLENNGASVQDKATPTDSKVGGSAMVFPKLEKESPTSSSHDISGGPEISSSTVSEVTAPETTERVPIKPTLPDAATETETDTLGDEPFEDVESMAFVEESSDDNGFFTDEEYDILDASDEEVVNHGKSGI